MIGHRRLAVLICVLEARGSDQAGTQTQLEALRTGIIETQTAGRGGPSSSPGAPAS